MKKLIPAILTTALLLSACGKKAEPLSVTEGPGNIPETVTEEVGTSWEDRPLQILDDKYRNYYEIFVGSFYDTSGDGTGDLKGVTEKLPYIREMGFNGIWLMPVMPSPTYHKYDVTDYCAIDPAYGSMEDFEELITKAHENDIHVIIDFVMNHSSSSHPWFLEACEFLRSLDPEDDRSVEELSEECPYVGYYHFSRQQHGGTWYEVSGTPFYYEGEFWSEMPDLNYRSEELWSDMNDIIRFWIDKGIDGFRMDATLHFEESDTVFNTEVMNRVYRYACSLNPDFYMVSEVWASEQTLASYYASETDSLFNFDAAGPEGKLIGCARGTLSAERFVLAMKQYEEDFKAAYPSYVDAVFLTNHDMGRVSNALNGDEDGIKFAGGLLLSMKGAPFVYYGEEIGMKSKGTKDENKRLPMLWSYDPSAPAASGTEGMTTGPADADQDITSKFPGVAQQLLSEDSILNYYRRALLLRNQNPEIARGSVTVVDELTEGDHAALIREYEGQKIAVLYCNAKDGEIKFTRSDMDLLGEKLGDPDPEIIGSLTTRNTPVSLDDNGLTLPARSIVYLK